MTDESDLMPPGYGKQKNKSNKQMVGEYELLEQVSSSPSGTVYRARQNLMQRTVLLKTMPTGSEHKDMLRKRFEREIRLATQFSHPNLVSAHHAGEQDGLYYLVLENVGPQYRQWNAAFDAGFAAALGKPLITLHDEELDHALKEIDSAARATARNTAQVVEILSYVLS